MLYGLNHLPCLPLLVLILSSEAHSAKFFFIALFHVFYGAVLKKLLLSQIHKNVLLYILGILALILVFCQLGGSFLCTARARIQLSSASGQPTVPGPFVFTLTPLHCTVTVVWLTINGIM